MRAAEVWVNHLARTLKTCRLYDANNPTVIRFREELAQALTRTLEEHGPLTLQFTSDDVLCDGDSLYPARSRDDNLALPFYRDGVHALTFSPGIEPAEVEAFLDALLLVTGQNAGENDLVTLLWEAHLQQPGRGLRPGRGRRGRGRRRRRGRGRALADARRRPRARARRRSPSRRPRARTARTTGRSGTSRSRWRRASPSSSRWRRPRSRRFLSEYDAEHAVPLATATIAIASAFLHAGAEAADRAELARFLPRVLRQTVTAGSWTEARHCLALLRKCGRHSEWSLESFTQELFQPISVAATIEKLDQQEPRDAGRVRRAGPRPGPAGGGLAQPRAGREPAAAHAARAGRGHRRAVPRRSRAARAVAGRPALVRRAQHRAHPRLDRRRAHDRPARDRDAPPRAARAAGGGGGARPGRAPSRARPLLLGMLEGADPRLFCSVLHQLSVERDAADRGACW